jgi:hypothetical protein
MPKKDPLKNPCPREHKNSEYMNIFLNIFIHKNVIIFLWHKQKQRPVKKGLKG